MPEVLKMFEHLHGFAPASTSGHDLAFERCNKPVPNGTGSKACRGTSAVICKGLASCPHASFTHCPHVCHLVNPHSMDSRHHAVQLGGVDCVGVGLGVVVGAHGVGALGHQGDSVAAALGGMVRATTERGISLWLALAEVLLCLLMFAACAAHVRWRLQVAKKLLQVNQQS
jgi:hypothetical protein